MEKKAVGSVERDYEKKKEYLYLDSERMSFAVYK